MTARREALYRLGDLADLASELGLEWRRVAADRLDVTVMPGTLLVFCNLVEESDTLVGFDGTPWHSHGTVQFMTGVDTYVEWDELDILVGLSSGELVVVSQYKHGERKDRWLAHKDEPLDLRHIEPGEELRVARVRVGRIEENVET